MMTFKDHFSGHAGLYAQARPHYPPALFDWIARLAPARELAWDAGCGNGQASVALAKHFDHVIATDPSAQQIGNAQIHPRVEYRVEPAEHTSIADGAIDAIVVAQALHWFDLPRFIGEVRRVAKPGALLVALAYANCSVNAAIDRLIAHLYEDVLGAYWTPERRLVDEGYASLALPFAPIVAPSLQMRMDWNAAQLLAYLSSWSAAQRHRRATGEDAVAAMADAMHQAWGDSQATRAVCWQLAIRAARIA